MALASSRRIEAQLAHFGIVKTARPVPTHDTLQVLIEDAAIERGPGRPAPGPELDVRIRRRERWLTAVRGGRAEAQRDRMSCAREQAIAQWFGPQLLHASKLQARDTVSASLDA